MENQVRIKLINVGREHWNGVVECPESRILEAVYIEARKHLFSIDVNVFSDGDITAGVRTVGHWEKLEVPNDPR